MKQILIILSFLIPSIAIGQNYENVDSINEQEQKDSIYWNEYQEKIDRITVSEICNVPFGCSYEKAKKILENKYGYSSSESDRTKIVYKNQTYAKIRFDTIYFLFQSDGTNSYMNGCVFIQETKSLKEAREKLNDLKIRLSYKYELTGWKDDEGESYYTGGKPPKNCNNWFSPAFSIDILKYDIPDSYKKHINSYATRLMYGRFDYVKEEF